MSPLGRKFRQKVLQLLRKQPGWGRPLQPLPLLQMRQNPADHMRLLDHRDHAQRAAATPAQGIDVIDLAEQTSPAATAPAAEAIGRGLLLGGAVLGERAVDGLVLLPSFST